MSHRRASVSLRAGLRAARQRTDEIFGIVSPGALIQRPIPERHRFLFYLGHLEAFDRNLLHPGEMGEMDRLFAFGIDPVDGALPDDLPSDWPSPPAARAWAARTRETVDSLLDREEADPLRLRVAVEHRLMHAETLVYMLRRTPLHQLLPPPGVAPPAPLPSPRKVSGLAGIPAGKAKLGLPGAKEDEPFGWDNERRGVEVEVPEFRIDRGNVTWREYLRFVREGGYADRGLWSDEGWRWKEALGLRHPRTWLGTDGAWRLRATFAEIPLPEDWPAMVSHAEASAFARWRGARLPTEAQHDRAAYGAPGGDEGVPPRAYPWGDAPPDRHRGNFGFQRWDPAATGSFPAGDSAFGVADLMGNGWEWTRSPFAPFPGFEPFPFYPGYSAPFFSRERPGAHRVLKGAGPCTDTRLLRRSFRNWFQPHYPYIDAAFRCVEE